MLVGRDVELSMIEDLMSRARSGRGAGLVLRGEPGIGKSALLNEAMASGSGLRTLRVVGVEAESQLAYAALHQLLLPALDRIDRLPAPQGDALRTAFGLTSGVAIQPFLVSVAALTLLSDLAEEQPVLCVIDDAQWSDLASLNTFAFVARRLETEAIALLIAVRDAEGRDVDSAGMRELRLEGLGENAAGRLLGDRADKLPLERLVQRTGGNPLALIELAETLSGPDLTVQEAMHDPLPVAERLERVFLDRVRRLGQEIFTLLLVAAAGPGDRQLISRVAGFLGVDGGILDDPEVVGLLHTEANTLTFKHPLVRSAVYHGASVVERRAVHRAFARALEDDDRSTDRRAWHRSKATEGPDDDVAAELESSAEQTLHRSGYLAATAALRRAAELSSASEDKARRLATAAEAAWFGGDTSTALALLDVVQQLNPDNPHVSLETRYLRGSIELRAGSPVEAVAILVPTADDAVNSDPHLALQIVLLAREAAYTAVRPEALSTLADSLARLPEFDAPEDRLLARLLSSFIRPVMDHARVTEVAADIAEVERFDDPALLLAAGGMAWAVGHFTLSARLRRRAVARARSLGAVGILAQTLEYLVPDEISRGRYASAEALADEGHRLAVEAGRRNSASLHLAFLAMLAGLRGREEEAEQLAERAMGEAVSRQLVKVADTAQRAVGLLALAHRHSEDALVAFGKLDGSGPEPGSPVMAVSAIPDHIEAAARAENTEMACELLERYLGWVEPTSSAELLALAHRARALLAETRADADAEYAEALRLHATTDRPFDHARTELLYGEFLRRERQRARARVHLRSAMETFTRLGTPVWAERARTELRATGETRLGHDVGDSEPLTPQELRVAQAVRRGATNREVAAEFFVSPRTVDYHLRKVFRKLGISSRRELMRLRLGDP